MVYLIVTYVKNGSLMSIMDWFLNRGYCQVGFSSTRHCTINGE